MLYAIIILSILVVILLLCIGVLLYGMKNNKKTFDGILGNDDVTEEEIISMVREGHEQGTILASEAELIHNVFEFDDKEVKDIMTHRKNIVSLDGSMSFIDAIEFIIDTGKSRFPVYENDVDSIIGVLHIKDAFTFFEKNEVYRSSIKDIEGLIRPVDFIPETVKRVILRWLWMSTDRYRDLSRWRIYSRSLSEISRMSTMRKKTTSERMMTRHL